MPPPLWILTQQISADSQCFVFVAVLIWRQTLHLRVMFPIRKRGIVKLIRDPRCLLGTWDVQFYCCRAKGLLTSWNDLYPPSLTHASPSGSHWWLASNEDCAPSSYDRAWHDRLLDSFMKVPIIITSIVRHRVHAGGWLRQQGRIKNRRFPKNREDRSEIVISRGSSGD